MADTILFAIGPQRSGSTWLYKLFANQKQGFYLDRKVKENYFFARDRPGTPEDLRRKFTNHLTGQGPLAAYVDVCSTYFGHSQCIARILAAFPEAKFVYTYRDPVSRAASFEKHRKMHGLSSWIGGYTISRELFDRQSQFEDCERKLREQVAPENLLRLEFSDLKADGGALWARQLADFLNIDIAPVRLGVVNKGMQNPSLGRQLTTLLKRLLRTTRVHLLFRHVVQKLTTRNRPVGKP